MSQPIDEFRLPLFRQGMKRVMHRYRAIYASPPRRWTFNAPPFFHWREHEHFFNVGAR